MSIYITGYEADPALMSGDDIIPFVEQAGQRDAWTTVTKFSALLHTLPVTTGTANGVLYLNGSKVVTSGSALTFDGTDLGAPAEVYRTSDTSFLRLSGGNGPGTGANVLMFGSTHATNPNRLSLNAPNATATSYIDFGVAGSEQMRLTSTGLGIGTSSPSAKLEVRNDVSATTSLDTTAIKLFNGLDGGSGIEFSNTVAGKSKISFGVESSGGGTDDTYIGFSTCLNAGALTERMRLGSSGNLGIGTSSPAAKLHAYSGTSMGQITADGTGAIKTGVNFANGGTTYGQIYFDNNSPYDMSVMQQYSTGSLRFGTNNTERVRIKSTGQLRFVPLAADPAGAEAGDVYYNSGTNKLRLYDGSTWVDLN